MGGAHASHVMPVTRELAAMAGSLTWGDLPSATLDMTKRLLLDGIGCMIVGARGADGRHAAAMVRRMDGARQATLLTDGQLASVRDAAFVNGICLYSVGLNDIHKPAGSHPAGAVIPVVLAVGEWLGSSGSDMLAAMVAGYEVIGRVGRAVRPSHRERGFHPTGTCGTFGATASAGRLLGLKGDDMASAFGIAGSQAAGLYECHHDGTSTMIFHAGRAAQNGVEAALLQQAGFTGPATVLEGSKGFFRATANHVAADAAMADFGKRFEIDETSFRPYFGCNSTIAASGATAQLVADGIRPEAVKAITVYCNAVPAQDNAEGDPRTLLAARLSLPFNIALVLVTGNVYSADLDEQLMMDPRIRALLPKISVVKDEAMTRYGARVVVTDGDGKSLERTITAPRGSPETPMQWDDIVGKFDRLTEGVISAAAQRSVADVVAGIESLDGPAVMQKLRDALD
jgi:2-methylcitrate dehydratase PrpD